MTWQDKCDLRRNKSLANDHALKILNERNQQDQRDSDLPSTDSDQHMRSNSQQPQISLSPLQHQVAHQPPPVMADALENLITALNSQTDIQAISSFSGNARDQYISSWLS